MSAEQKNVLVLSSPDPREKTGRFIPDLETVLKDSPDIAACNIVVFDPDDPDRIDEGFEWLLQQDNGVVVYDGGSAMLTRGTKAGQKANPEGFNQWSHVYVPRLGRYRDAGLSHATSPNAHDILEAITHDNTVPAHYVAAQFTDTAGRVIDTNAFNVTAMNTPTAIELRKAVKDFSNNKDNIEQMLLAGEAHNVTILTPDIHIVRPVVDIRIAPHRDSETQLSLSTIFQRTPVLENGKPVKELILRTDFPQGLGSPTWVKTTSEDPFPWHVDGETDNLTAIHEVNASGGHVIYFHVPPQEDN